MKSSWANQSYGAARAQKPPPELMKPASMEDNVWVPGPALARDHVSWDPLGLHLHPGCFGNLRPTVTKGLRRKGTRRWRTRGHPYPKVPVCGLLALDGVRTRRHSQRANSYASCWKNTSLKGNLFARKEPESKDSSVSSSHKKYVQNERSLYSSVKSRNKKEFGVVQQQTSDLTNPTCRCECAPPTSPPPPPPHIPASPALLTQQRPGLEGGPGMAPDVLSLPIEYPKWPFPVCA